MANPGRPIGVKAVTILEIIGGILTGFIGLVMLWNVSMGYERTLSNITNYSVLVLLGVVNIIVGWGVWKGKGWAWISTLALTVLGIIGSAVCLISPSVVKMWFGYLFIFPQLFGIAFLGGGNLTSSFIALVMELIIIRTLFHSQTKAHFNK